MAESSQACTLEPLVPEVVGPIAESFKIRRGRNQTEQWLTHIGNGDLGWSNNAIIALGFKSNNDCLVQVCMERARNENLPTLSRQEELVLV
jgi:hypothetical protein